MTSRAAAVAAAPAPASRRARPVRTGAASVAASPRALVERPRKRIAPVRPRRVSGPARVPSRGASARATTRLGAGVGGALVLAAVGVCEHRVLDRVVRGRVWIALVTCALLGIVTLQLGLLELNGGIGRVLARKALLEQGNSTLRIENSTLASDEHVMAAAVASGMVPVPIQGLRFLDAHGASSARAASSLRVPVQQPASESSGAAGGASEASSSGETGSGIASTSSSSSSSSESTASSEASQPASSVTRSSETARTAPPSSTGASEAAASQSTGASEAAASQSAGASEAGGASASAGGGG